MKLYLFANFLQPLIFNFFNKSLLKFIDFIKVNASFAAASLALSKFIEISDTIHPLFKFCNNVSNSYYSQIRKNNLLNVNIVISKGRYLNLQVNLENIQEARNLLNNNTVITPGNKIKLLE